MYKQTLCVTLPISAAVIIAAALFANAGDLNPPEGPIGPTMHTLDEIYELAAAQQPCPPCTWEYWSNHIPPKQEVLAIEGSGILHGLWIIPDGRVVIFDGATNGPRIGEFRAFTTQAGSQYGYIEKNEFFELNVAFDDGILLTTLSSEAKITLLYSPTNP